MMFDIRKKEKNKTDRIVIRVSPEEKQELKRYCKEKNIDLSKYVYNLISVDMTMFHNKHTEKKEKDVK